MIYLPPPQLSNKDIRISGDVEIHPTASLAPGVILQAVPSQRIVIGADVCIGMGVIINASQGSVEIESGAIIGSGVLIIGACKIGNNACIGTAVTIFQANIEAMTVIEPGSILGDNSRKVDLSDRREKQQNEDNQSRPNPEQKVDTSKFQPNKGNQKANNYKSRLGSDGYYSPTQARKVKVENTEPDNIYTAPSEKATVSPPTQINKEINKDPVVGQVYINQLLVTLFPHNRDFDSKAKKLQ